MNRFLRRLERFGRSLSSRRAPGSRQQGTVDASTPPDVTSPRAKSMRHGKVTADKWNQ